MSEKKAIAGTHAAAHSEPELLLRELKELILGVRSQVAQTVNTGLTMLYWQVGTRIRRELLKEKRVEYGAEILQSLAAKFEAEFRCGFSETSLRHMIRFAEAFPDFEIVSALLRQLSWTHFKSIILTFMKALSVAPEHESYLWERRPRRDLGVAPTPMPLTFMVKKAVVRNDLLQRDFYPEMRRIERWSTL